MERVLNKNKQIFPTGLFHLVKAPVKFTSIKDIRVVDDPDGRKILFPDHFDGRIQIDVRSFIYNGGGKIVLVKLEKFLLH